MDAPVYFVENLTLQSWVVSIYYRLLRDRVGGSGASKSCYFFYASRAGILLARATAWIVNARIRSLEFSMKQVNDESDLPMYFRSDQDLFQVLRHATTRQVFHEAVRDNQDRPRLSMFLTKKISYPETQTYHTARRALFLVYVCAWKTRRNHPQGSVPLLFLERIPWLNAVIPIAAHQGIGISTVPQSPSPDTLLRRLLPREFMNMLRLLRYRRFRGTVRLLKRKWVRSSKVPGPSSISHTSEAIPETIPTENYLVAAEYIGQLNLHHPEFHSNFFFWHQSSLAGSDMMVIFTHSSCPLDDLVQTELTEHGMTAVATHHGATSLANAPVFSGPRYRRRRDRREANLAHSGPESQSLKEQISEYVRLRDYWTALFEAYGIRVFVTYNKLDTANCAIGDALESLGGITVNYERSHQTYERPDLAGSADVMFNVSQVTADLEIRSGSAARYHVVTGYLGDHRFSMLQDGSRTIRDNLRRQGAKHVIAFFDENSIDDTRWALGHQPMREDYTFLLEKVVKEPWFGLVIKPKAPRSLRRRLGPVAGLLEKAEATGRCYLFEAGGIQGWHPPAAAALAADVAVHGDLRSSTAGMEAALAGVPTLLFDPEGWHVSPFYRLGEGRVVFNNWEGLWEACNQHWAKPEGLPGFGDWSPMLDELDPFRDGCAAGRMGNYIKSLIEGLRAGRDRETVMAETAEHYRTSWGQDKVIQTIPQPGPRMETREQAACRVTASGQKPIYS